jgi:hypothetical protein
MGAKQTAAGSTSKKATQPVATSKLIKKKGNQVSRLPLAIQRSSSASPHTPPHTPRTPPAPSYAPLSIPRSTGEANLRHLSISPSTILRPLLEHGPLPASPTKKSDAADAKVKQRFGHRQKENASGVFRSLLQSTLTRKCHEEKPTDAASNSPASEGSLRTSI